MTLEGIVVNGVIVLNDGPVLAEGAKVRVEVDDPDDLGPPPEPYDREKELAILREAGGCEGRPRHGSSGVSEEARSGAQPSADS